MADRALIFPGLVPLSDRNLKAVLAVDDDHLRLAAEVCGFDPASVLDEYGTDLPGTVHEPLLTVAILRRVAEHGGFGAWQVFGGPSAGCLPALLAAGAVDEATCYRLGHRINAEQLDRRRSGRPLGVTVAVAAPHKADADRLLGLLAARGIRAELAVDLGDGLVAIAVDTDDPERIQTLLTRLGTFVVAAVDRPEHCSFAVPGRDRLTALVAEADIGPARRPVVSPMTGRLVDGDPSALRTLLVDQWYAGVSLPLMVDGMCAVPGVAAVDLVSPAQSVYVSRTRRLVGDRADHHLLELAG